MTKLSPTIILVFAFISIAVFGFAGMNHGEDGHLGCLASKAATAPCPESNPEDFIAFHLSAFKSFTTALLILLVLSIGAGIAATGVETPQPKLRQVWQFSKTFSPIYRKNFSRWLALHETSPTLN